MKKIICILIVCILLLSINVSAMDLTEMTEKLLKYYDVKVTEDVSGISKLQNRRNLKNPGLISAAIKNGIIVSRSGIVNETGTDFTPLTDGIIKRYINDDNYMFVCGTAEELKNKNIVFDKDTFYVTEKGRQSDIKTAEICTCVADKDGKALFVWKPGEIVQPALYKVKLYWAEGKQMIVSDIYRKEYDSWINESTGSYIELDSSNIGLSTGFVMQNLDKYIYVFADSYGGNIKVMGISR